MDADAPPLPQPESARPLPTDDFERWYGPWDPLDPSTIGEFLDGFDRPWWIAGGWALEKWSGIVRDHEDLDISFAHHDAPALRDFLIARRYTPWNADDGWLRPYDGRFGDIRPDSQMWVRSDSRSPWVLDALLTPFRNGQWTNKRLPEQAAPLDEVTWIADDGLRYLNPEVVLFMKARQTRAKDVADAEACLPLLDERQRAWLAATVRAWEPEHPWGALG